MPSCREHRAVENYSNVTLYHPYLIKYCTCTGKIHEVSVGLSSATDPKNLRGNHPIACSGKPKLSMTLYNIMQDYESFSQEKRSIGAVGRYKFYTGM